MTLPQGEDYDYDYETNITESQLLGPFENAMKKNAAALDGYRVGWAVGDSDIILGVCTDTFNFTWVPDQDVVSRARFPGFFADFKAAAEAANGKQYYMRFDNIIHRTVRNNIIISKMNINIFD